MSRILVTGGSGFIGLHLINALLLAKHDVRALARPDSQRIHLIPPKAQIFTSDITDKDTLKKSVQDIEIVVHLAATAFGQKLSVQDPLRSAQINLWGTTLLLEQARLAGVKRFILASSSGVYGDAPSPLTPSTPVHPLTPYALHKFQSELLLRQYAELYNIETLSLRLSHVYGPGMRSVPGWQPVMLAFLERMAQQQPLLNENGSLLRDFVHVHDVVSAFKLACQSSQIFRGEVLNIASGKPIRLSSLAELLNRTTEHHSQSTAETEKNVYRYLTNDQQTCLVPNRTPRERCS